MTGQDATMERIQEATALLHRGERAAARTRFAAVWEEIGPDGDPLHRCVTAHYMADAQDDPQDELLWDQRALAAAECLTEARVHPTWTVRSFYPSLHLNLAASYRAVGELAQARAHLACAAQSVDALPDDGYGNLIRAGIARLAGQLGADPLSPGCDPVG